MIFSLPDAHSNRIGKAIGEIKFWVKLNKINTSFEGKCFRFVFLQNITLHQFNSRLVDKDEYKALSRQGILFKETGKLSLSYRT